MKNLGNKGFSAKEFGIVAIAIIVAIWGIMPHVFDVIEKTRLGAVTDNVALFRKDIDRMILDQLSAGNEVLDGCYVVTDDGNLCLEEIDGVCNKGNLTVDHDGIRPDGGEVNIKDNKVDGVYNIFIENKYVNEKEDKYVISDAPNPKIICE